MISHDAAAIDKDTRRRILEALKTDTPGRAAKRAQKMEDRAHELKMLERLRVKHGHNPAAHRAAVAAWRSLAPTRLFIERAWKLWLAQQADNDLREAIEKAARADTAPRHVARNLGIPIRRAHYLLTLAREDMARAERREETNRALVLAERARQWADICEMLAAKPC